MWLALDETVPDGHAFFDDNLDGYFSDLTDANLHGVLAIRAIVTKAGSGSSASQTLALHPEEIVKESFDVKRAEIVSSEGRKDVASHLVVKRLEQKLQSEKKIDVEESMINGASSPTGYNIYRSESSPVVIDPMNRIASVAATVRQYADTSGIPGKRYWYVVTAAYAQGESSPSNEVMVDIPTAVERRDMAGIPTEFGLAPNYPNPFNPETVIQYQLPKQAEVRLEIYNILGELVKTLVDEKQAAGYYTVRWNGKDEHGRSVASGVYLYSVRAGEFVQVRKMILVR